MLAFDMQLFVFQSHSPQPGDNTFGLIWRSIVKYMEYKARKANPLDCDNWNTEGFFYTYF